MKKRHYRKWVFALLIGIAHVSNAAIPAHAGGSVTYTVTPKGNSAQALKRLSRFQERTNRARVEQYGRNNTAQLSQSGRGNTLGVYQIGRGHSATAAQDGNNNTLGIFQFGKNTSTNTSQSGNGRSSLIFQGGW